MNRTTPPKHRNANQINVKFLAYEFELYLNRTAPPKHRKANQINELMKFLANEYEVHLNEQNTSSKASKCYLSGCEVF